MSEAPAVISTNFALVATDAAPAAAIREPPIVPTVALITVPRVSLEVIAIAAAVFALVQSLVWLALPFELVWLAVIGLAVNRRTFEPPGRALMFARPRRARRVRATIAQRAQRKPRNT